MKNEVKISLRLPEDFVNDLESIRANNNDKSLSHTIRHILINAINNEREQHTLRTVERRLMKKLNELETLLTEH